ncbi:hypothetical protein M0Q97_11620 [Candidatus Dojkabacteria bacterium]|jgi:hypothetical protein|nr:hypothetical protein [Candidatus Dojkabacteria bacterium]
MSQNKYIVSNDGFLKEIQLKEKRSKERDLFDIIWTSKLREAQKFTTNQANLVIKKHNLNCFVWNPYEEEHVKEYEVVRRSSFHNFFDDSNHNVLEWLVVKNFSPKTDIRFLTNGLEELYDFDTATRIAKEKNELILLEISNILNKI